MHAMNGILRFITQKDPQQIRKNDGLQSLGYYLVGAFNPSEKYWSNWIISSSRGEHKKKLKPPTSYGLMTPKKLKEKVGFNGSLLEV